MTGRRQAEKWHDVIGDHTFGNAMPDRLVDHSQRLALTGRS
jgi:hypothetical protein